MAKGVLWVSSRVTEPEKLSPETFCEWYENIHIQQVLTLPGLPSAIRYEAMQPQPSSDTWSSEAPWLTLYEMPEIAYKNSPAFRALDGQSPPSQDLLDSIFKNSRFDTRFYTEIQSHSSLSPPGPTTFLFSAALEPPSTNAGDFDAWYRDEHIAILSRAPGFVRTRRYELVSGTTLEAFERTSPELPRYLALHEFGGEELPWKQLGESTQTEWAKRVLGSLVREEVGWFKSKRVYGEEEWGKVGLE